MIRNQTLIGSFGNKGRFFELSIHFLPHLKLKEKHVNYGTKCHLTVKQNLYHLLPKSKFCCLFDVCKKYFQLLYNFFFFLTRFMKSASSDTSTSKRSKVSRKIVNKISSQQSMSSQELMKFQGKIIWLCFIIPWSAIVFVQYIYIYI